VLARFIDGAASIYFVQNAIASEKMKLFDEKGEWLRRAATW
jgi:hypothetical protein